MHIRNILPFAAFLALAACGSSDDAGVGDPGNEDPGNQETGCSITLSGEVTGTYSCTATAGRVNAEGASVLGAIGLNLGGSLRTLSISAKLTGGDPAVRDYAPTDFETTGAILLTGDNRGFFATHGSANDMGTLGTFKVTGLDRIPGVEDGKAWKLHGSFNATLIDPASKKTVTLTAKF